VVAASDRRGIGRLAERLIIDHPDWTYAAVAGRTCRSGAGRKIAGKKSLRYLEVRDRTGRLPSHPPKKPFRDHYNKIAEARVDLQTYLAENKKHHFFVPGAEEEVDETETAE